ENQSANLDHASLDDVGGDTTDLMTATVAPSSLRWAPPTCSAHVLSQTGAATSSWGSIQIRAVLSPEAVTTRDPSGLKLAATTPPSCRSGSPSGLPVRASQSRAVLSQEAVTTRDPSALKLAATTAPSCRSGSPRGLPVRASQSRAVLSQE